MAAARPTPGELVERVARSLTFRVRGALALTRRPMAELRMAPVRLPPWWAARRARGRYRLLSAEALRGARRSDTVFVFGSGASLLDLGPDDWADIAAHDTFGFNWFVHQRFVRCDFHLVRRIADSDRDASVWRPEIEQYFSLIRSSPEFADTVLLLQHEPAAIAANRALALGLVELERRVFLWRTRPGDELSRSLDEGLCHGSTTLLDTVNAAYLMGWRRIVLVGVDLYDRRYFWLPPGEARWVDAQRGAVAASPHSQSGTGLIERMRNWRIELSAAGVDLEVHNPRSLLREALPLYLRGDG